MRTELLLQPKNTKAREDSVARNIKDYLCHNGAFSMGQKKKHHRKISNLIFPSLLVCSNKEFLGIMFVFLTLFIYPSFSVIHMTL